MASTDTTTPPASPSQQESNPQSSPTDHHRPRSHSSLSASPSSPIPPPIPVETHPNRAAGFKPLPFRQHSHSHSHPHSHSHSHSHSHVHAHAHAHSHASYIPDPTRLAPEDAYYAAGHPHAPPPRPRPPLPSHAHTHTHVTNHAASLRVPGSPASVAAVAALRPPPAVPGTEAGKLGVKEHSSARTRRRRKRKRVWKKLLWVKQSFPDNYTDTETFLDHLQRNPRLRPYDFWPLVADFTVIVQHVCSVVIFVCCFTVIFQERVSPVSVVSCGSLCTILGWVFWDFWVGKEHEMTASRFVGVVSDGTGTATDEDSSSNSAPNGLPQGLGLALRDLRPPNQQDTADSSRSHSSSEPPSRPTTAPLSPGIPSISYASPTGTNTPSSTASSNPLTPRNRQRLATAKSGFLIFCFLQGLSPILKSLTKSTTSDSIWAMSCWLMIINVFFFDYSTGEKNTTSSGSSAAAKFPASLSTNAALMASTVLASRLKSTTHVFSLTLFSIEVFGLFPVFRRHLRAISWTGHVLLTVSLVIAASAAVGITLKGGIGGAILGVLIGGPATAVVMGGCSWWLISLQKYKNVVTGPWDTAKPVLRRHWD